MEQNPFVYYEPVKGKDFFNREDIIKKIEKITIKEKQQGNVWLIGERQSGKTSLLHKIYILYKDENPSVELYSTGKEFKVKFIYFNCQMIRDDNSFYQHLTQTFINHFDFKISKKKNHYDNFINCLIKIHQLNYYLIFLFDEFDAFIEKYIRKSTDDAAHFLDTFNVIKQDIPGLKDRTKAFGFVCASNSTFSDLTGDIKLSGSGFTSVRAEELLHFTEEQLLGLCDRYLEGNPIQFSEDEIKFCYQMTKGYPFFVQNLFSIIYENKIKKTGDLPKSILTKEIKKKFRSEFEKTLKEWKKQKRLTIRTKEKIQKIAKEIAVDVTAKAIAETVK